MALYESFDRDDLDAAATPDRRLLSGGFTAMVRLVLVSLLLSCWLAGAYGGIVYWSHHGSLLGVIASLLVPGVEITLIWMLFTRLGSQ